MGSNGGAYSKRKFERLAKGSSPDFENNLTPDDMNDAINDDQLLVQFTGDSLITYLPKLPQDVTLKKVQLLCEAAGCTTTTASGLTADLIKLAAGYGTTVNLATIQATATIEGIIDNSVTATAEILTTEALAVSWGATTLVNDGGSLIIQYSKN